MFGSKDLHDCHFYYIFNLNIYNACNAANVGFQSRAESLAGCVA